MLDFFRDSIWEGVLAFGTLFFIVITFFFPDARNVLFSHRRKFLYLASLIGIFSLGIFIGIRFFQSPSQELSEPVNNVVSSPLQLLEKYDFELNSPTNTEPWKTENKIPGENDKFLINTEASNALGSQSLQIKSELLNVQNGDWISVYIDELPTEKISLAKAWVFIPLNEHTEDRNFQGKLDLLGDSISISSGLVLLEPGEWTQLMVEGLPNEINLISGENATPVFPDSPNNLAITILHDAANTYTGSVYIDNVELYGER